MTKSTDKSLIEDTEIPAEELVEDLVEDREVKARSAESRSPVQRPACPRGVLAGRRPKGPKR